MTTFEIRSKSEREIEEVRHFHLAMEIVPDGDYSTTPVEHIDVQALLPVLMAGCIVALDVAKHKFVGAIATMAGEIVKLFRFEHTKQTHQFLDVVRALQRALEPDKRQAESRDGANRHVRRLDSLSADAARCVDLDGSAELFDDVASLHDPKSALVAKICSMNLATKWEEPSKARPRLRALVDLREHESQHQDRCFNRLEARLARHWPELGESLDLRGVSTLKLLIAYPSPARVAEKPEEAGEALGVASRRKLSVEAISTVVTNAKESFGVPASDEEELAIKTLASQAYDAKREADQRA